jgi:AcrR family transcriptional regulator
MTIEPGASSETETPPDGGRLKPGRKRDAGKDQEILRAALAVLAELGYDGTTIDIIAARANAGRATVYRRWSTKAELILDAIESIGQSAPARTLPDTGTLAGDFHELLSVANRSGNARPMQIISGLIPVLKDNPELSSAVTRRMIAPQAAAMRAMLQRAKDRGEIPEDRNLDMLTLVLPAFSAYRAMIMNEPMDASYVDAIIDDILIPASGAKPTH